MEHLVCKSGSEYDVEGTTGSSHAPVDARCEVSALKPGTTNVHYMLIMTRHGRDQKAG
jgi:hypothetical protein